MSLKKLFQILLGIQFALAIGLAILTFSLFLNQKELSHSQRVHFKSYLLADELRQSSDDLTRLARTYVATSNEEFERQYWEVLDIRNGNSPRPMDYNRIYWDFVTETERKPRADGAKISLHELMIKEGFTDAELEKLTLSQKYSDDLVRTEKIAMNAVKGLFDDGAGNFTVKKKPDRALAIKLMNDETYHKSKVNIMKPIDEFYVMFDERTTKDVAMYERRAMNLLLSLGVLIVIIMGMFGYSFVIIQRQINERIRAVEELKESEGKFRSLAEESPNMIFINKVGHVVYANKKCEEVMGYTREEFLNTKFNFLDLIAPEHVEMVKENFADRYKGKAKDFYEYILITKDKRRITASIASKIINYEGGSAILGTVTDITDRKRAEEALRESEEKYRELVEASPDAIIIYSEGKIVFANRSSVSLMRASNVVELIGKPVIEFVHPAYKEFVIKRMMEMIKSGKASSLAEEKFLRLDGSEVDVEVKAIPIVYDKKPAIQVIVRDITDRKRGEEALRDSELRYRTVLQQSLEAIYLYDVETQRVLEANPTFLNLLGYNAEEASLLTLYDIVAHDRANVDAYLQHILASEGIPLGERLWRRKDGTTVQVEVTANMVKQGDRTIAFFVARDITERKRSEEEIAMLAHSLRSVNECVSITDMEDKILFVNESFLKTYGYDENELVGKHVNLVRSINNPLELVKEILPATIRGGWQGELWNRRKDGSEFPIYLSTTIINDKDSKPLGLIGVAKDITERKRAEKELIEAKEKAEESDKLKSEFLAQMSHEIRTPINAIVGNVDFLNDSFGVKTDSDTRDCFEGIDLASKRIIRTVDLILNAAELQTSGYKSEFVKVDLNSEILNKLYKEHQLSARQKELELIYKCEVKESKVIADEYSITQIFANLIDNAIKYTKKGKVEILLLKNKTGNIMVEIKDTGIGMSKEFLPKLFEPFVQEEQGYTRSFDGNGLGLSLVKNYCDINNAIIEVESEKNVGTTFRIIFKS